MDCRTSESAAGIDPKILDNWQDIPTWDHPAYEQPLEWDTSQDSSQGDDSADMNAAQASLARDLLGPSVPFSTADSKPGTTTTSPDHFGLVEAPIDGTVSGTMSPRTLPPSADDHFQLDDSWRHYQMLNAMTTGIPMDSSLYPYSKGSAPANNTVIVGDAGELSQDPGYGDLSDPLLAFQNMLPPLAFNASEPWSDSATTSPAPVSMRPGAPGSLKEANMLRGFPESTHPLHPRWTPAMESQLPAAMISPPVSALSYETGLFGGDQRTPDGFHYRSETSSVSGDLSGVYECSYSATSDDHLPVAAAAERPLDGDHPWGGKNESPSESVPPPPPQQQATAFMVSETPPESFLVSAPPRSRAASAAAPRSSDRPSALALQSAATVRKRKQRSANASLDHGQPKPLQIVQEDGQGGSIASADFVSPPRGARRKGPLSMAGRANAGLRRKNKDTCVQCRLNKRKCDGNAPCDACRPTLHEQPCAKACFASIVEYGTCNYISQRAVNHPTLDRARRVRMEIPVEFDLNELLSILSQRQGRFNIRASQAWGSLYVLDLAETYKFLKNLSDCNGNSRSNFLDFVDRRILESKDKSKNWLTCVKDCDPMNHVYTLLSQWNNMPSRASYSFVPVDGGGEERPMDIQNESDRREILLAAQLSRIICRMLEVEGFRKLERDFYNIKWKQISQETHLRFLRELGHILLTLRWRVSWWKRLGDGGRDPDPTKQHYVDRVDLLCRILYVYYTCVLAKLPSWSASDVPKGVWSSYADSENAVWDDFPADPTDEGFQRWIDRGQDLIDQAGVRRRVAA